MLPLTLTVRFFSLSLWERAGVRASDRCAYFAIAFSFFALSFVARLSSTR